MRRFTVMAAAVAVMVALAGCLGTARLSVRTGEAVVDSLPEQPVSLVSTWACIETYDADRRTSNRGYDPAIRTCRGANAGEYAIEFLGDGSGYDVKMNRESRGAQAVYIRADSFRWQTLDRSTLRIVTTVDRKYTVRALSPDVIRAGNRLWFRVGSPAYERLWPFRDCIESNRGKKLYEVRDCGDPING